MRRFAAIWTFALVYLASAPAAAQSLGDSLGSPLNLVLLLAALAVLPFLLIMVTSFVKIAVVLSILRQAIGAQQVPPNQVITGLAIVLSLYVMAPVGYDIYHNIEPQLQTMQQEDEELGLEGLQKMAAGAAAPLRRFLQHHSDPKEQGLMYRLAVELDAGSAPPNQPKHPRLDVPRDSLLILVPAFVVTELKEAFTIGFVLFVPFIIIDLVVANILLSLGMHMLSPTTVSLPFKLLLFVLVDGWFLVVKGLVLGYAPT